jgi:hypothetical protein
MGNRLEGGGSSCLLPPSAMALVEPAVLKLVGGGAAEGRLRPETAYGDAGTMSLIAALQNIWATAGRGLGSCHVDPSMVTHA